MPWFRLVVRSYIWIALGASLLALLTEIECFAVASVAPLVVGFSTLLVYNLLRWVKLKRIRSTHLTIQQAGLPANVHAGLVLLAALGLAFTLRHLPEAGLLILTVAALPAISYGFRIIPSSKGWLSPRELPHVKLPLIAFVWTLATVLYPAVQAENHLQLPSNQVLLYGAERLLFVLALTIPFDVRDMHLDDLSIRTLPMAIGQRRSGYLAMLILSLLSMLHLVYSEASADYAYSSVYAGSALAIWPLAHRKLNELPPLYFTGFLDGMLILLPAAVLLLRLVSHV